MLAIEIMGSGYINSITKYRWFDQKVKFPWLAVYPDLGNLSARGNNVAEKLKKGIHRTVGAYSRAQCLRQSMNPL
jgi:hexulose-6-phosphate isomerase